MIKNKHSLEKMEKARSLFPGGVNSPVRSFKSVEGSPIVFRRGEGKYLYDVDGNRFTDFCASWGPLILGYGNKAVLEALETQAQKALTFGAPSEEENFLALKIKEWMPSVEMMRFVSSGTEATMSAIRLARSYTGRNKFIKFQGCYHGHADHLLVAAGSGLATLGTPSSSGVPAQAVVDTLTPEFNNKVEVETLFEKFGSEIACIIVEPMACNMGLVLPDPGFLKFLRDITSRHGALLIFDEVMTGFRIAKGGAEEAFDVKPDLWTFGKIMGGGLPAAAYGGRRDIMERLAPLGTCYQAGTLSGNPLAMAAGRATLLEMERVTAFHKLEELGDKLDSIVKESGILSKVAYVRKASFFCFFFGTTVAPRNFKEVAATNMNLFNKVYHAWLERGIYMGPSGYEVGFLSTEHHEEDLKALVHTIVDVLK